MSTAALALVLGAALLHAIWNVVAKKASGDACFAFLSTLLLALLWAPLGIAVGWRIVPTWGVTEWTVLLASAAVHVVYFVTLLRGYRVADLTVVYPVARGSGPLLASIGAIVFLGEHLGVVGALGLFSVAIGVFFIAGGPSIWRAGQAGATRSRVRDGLVWGALTGALIGVYTLVDGYAVRALLLAPILVNYCVNLLQVPLLLPMALRDPGHFRTVVRTQWRAALTVAVLGPIGYVLVLEAMRLAPISHVAPAREVSMLFAALLGGRLLGEGQRLSRFFGALCIGTGVAALSFA